MRKSYLMLAAAALFVACSSNDLTESPKQTVQSTDDGAIVFSAYLNRGTTRAGLPGTLTTTGTSANVKNQSLHQTGFGVLSYYGNGEPYSENSKPDFMYNQKVSGPDWTYNPIKYWPNEFGSDAISEGTDRLTFFAYAPYVDVNLTTGIAEAGSGEEPTTGIIALTRNTTHGDPFVKYYADFNPEKRVDLCWGVAKSDFNSSVTGTENKVLAGKPYIDVVKPKVGDKINFDFKHALAALNVTIDADVDLAGHGTTTLDGRTKIWVRSITFEGFTDKGMLNLNGVATSSNYTPEWYDLSGNNKLGSGGKTTIYDGRRDGSEPLGEASNESPAALNPQIVQSYIYDANPYTSLVTTTALSGVPDGAPINLFNSTTATEPIYVIPTNDDVKVTIVYDVETSDENLTNYLSDGVVRGSSVENKITKEIKLSGSNFRLQAGKFYTIAIHLGMTSVKFDASVTEWTEGNPDPTWLPVNGEAFTAGTSGSITVPATVTNQSFSVTGFGDGATVTATAASNTVIAAAPSASSVVSGSSTITFTTIANTTVKNRPEVLTIAETGGNGTTTTITVNQKAAPLGLTNSGIADDKKTITLASTGEQAAKTDWENAGTHWKVVKTAYDGSKTTLSQVPSLSGSNQYLITGTSTTAATLKLNDEAQVGDVYTITCQAGNAEEETTIVRIGGIMFINPTTAVAKGGSVTNAVVLVGNGTVAYTSGTTANATVDTNGKVTGVLGSGTSDITATLTPSGSDYSYPASLKTATYTINLANIAVGGIYEIINAAATNATFTVCGLVTGSATTITSEATWLSALSVTTAGAGGIRTVTYTAAANDAAGSPERSATVTINGKQITIKQAGN